MGGRDHSCDGCGRGGFNDPDGRCECIEEASSPTWRPRDYRQWTKFELIAEIYALQEALDVLQEAVQDDA